MFVGHMSLALKRCGKDLTEFEIVLDVLVTSLDFVGYEFRHLSYFSIIRSGKN